MMYNSLPILTDQWYSITWMEYAVWKIGEIAFSAMQTDNPRYCCDFYLFLELANGIRHI
jgi:hypothetical protein